MWLGCRSGSPNTNARVEWCGHVRGDIEDVSLPAPPAGHHSLTSKGVLARTLGGPSSLRDLSIR